MLKSKHKSQSNKQTKNVENELNEFNKIGRSNLSQQAKCDPNATANKR